jgi:hypothetical protein
MLNEDTLSNNINVKNNQNSILNHIQTYNDSKNENNTIPEPSDYGSFTQNELNSEYLLARYPNGIINVSNTKGNPHITKVSNINLNNTVYKNTNNTTVTPNFNVSFPKQSYTIESFSNINTKNNKNFFLLIILCILFIIWLLKIKNH